MKVLIVNYHYPPVVGAHCYRWHQLAQHWNRVGHEVHVVTSKVAGLPFMRDEAGISVCRTGFTAHKALERSSVATSSKVRGAFLSRLINILRPFYRRVYWPDAMYHWLPFVLWQIWTRRKNSYDVVITYYPAFASVLSGWFYRKMSKDKSFTWIADYGDPFSTSESMPPNNYALFRRLNIFVERLIARKIDKLVLTSADTRADYMEAGIAPAEKLEVIPSLVDVELFYSMERMVSSNSSAEVNLVYVGALHRNIREPGILYQLIDALNKMKGGPPIILNMYGPNNGVDVEPEGNPWVRYHGPVAREEAISLMREADILVDIGNDNCSMIPSKATEYVATGKAILTMRGNGLCHPAMMRYEDVGRVLVVDKHHWDSVELDAAQRFIFDNRGSCVDRNVVEEVLDSFSLVGIALRYEGLIRRTED